MADCFFGGIQNVESSAFRRIVQMLNDVIINKLSTLLTSL